MNTTTVIKEGLSYGLWVALSCGPSQVFGLIKGTIDLVRWNKIRNKIHKYTKFEKSLTDRKIQVLSKDKVFKKVAEWFFNQKLTTNDQIQRLLDNQSFISTCKDLVLAKSLQYSEAKKKKKRSIQADLVALIPLVGAIFSWRVHSNYWGVASTAGFERAVPQLLEDHHKLLAKYILYPLSKTSQEIGVSDHIKIPVNIGGKKRTLDAIYYKNQNPGGPTAVLFHGNAMTCNDMVIFGKFYQSNGFNVLMPTIGGYPGSEGVDTSESTTYQDVEAIKQYLKKKGVKRVGYHGLSIGGSLAFQAAAGKSNTKLETLFVVADQTFTTAGAVAANCIKNFGFKSLAPIARGVIKVAVPAGRKVVLSKNLIIETDGLDNIAKASILKEKNIPFIAIKSETDFLMGRNMKILFQNTWATCKAFQYNFADYLL